MAWRNKFKQRQAFKKKISKELILLAWHPTRLWDWCLPDNEKKSFYWQNIVSSC